MTRAKRAARWTRLLGVVGVGWLGFTAAGGLAQQDTMNPLVPSGTTYHVGPHFQGKHEGDVALDLSGIACLPAATGQAKRCLVVNDEGTKAQFAIIDGNRIVPGQAFDLIGDAPSDATRGKKPDGNCPKPKVHFAELDGEGAAYEAPYFYVVGSHGCGRHNGKFKLSSFILARIDIGAAAERFGENIQTVETTYRLSDALKSQAVLAPHFARGLDQNGLNIEGVAVVGARLYAGLRAPSLNGTAFLVSVRIADLFAPGHAALALGSDPRGDIVPLALGKDVGIRDLSALPDGRLLVLAGPAQEQAVPYSLHVVDPRQPRTLRALGKLPSVPGPKGPAKAEAVVLLDASRVLVMFDGLPDGVPREYAVQLR